MLNDLTAYAKAKKDDQWDDMHNLATTLIPWLINSGKQDREHALYHEGAHYWAWNTTLYTEGQEELDADKVHDYTL